MNKKLKLLIFIGMIGMTLCSFGQKFSEGITRVKIKENTISFHKEIVYDSIFFNLKFDSTMLPFVHKISTEEWLEIYTKGKILNPEKYWGPHKLDSFEPISYKNFLLLGQGYGQRPISFLDKEKGIVTTKNVLVNLPVPNVAMIGFICWFLMIVFHMSDFRRTILYRDVSHKISLYTLEQAEENRANWYDMSKDLMFAKSMGIISMCFFALGFSISALVNDGTEKISWNVFGLAGMVFFIAAIFIRRYTWQRRIDLYKSNKVFYRELFFLLLLLLVASIDLIGTLFYGVVMFPILYFVSRRFQKEIDREKEVDRKILK